MNALRFGGRTVLATDPDFNPEEVDMDFRLTFDGLLLGTKNKSRHKHVHCIRRKFHPQLRHFWDKSPAMNVSEDVQALRHRRAAAFAMGNYQFIPLVTREDQYICVLDVLLLRSMERATSVFEKGDIDGQLATIFDALMKPQHLEQLEGVETPMDGEAPFYVLLQDDSLITGVSVETGLLLQTTEEAGIEENAARAVVRVRVSWPPKDRGFSRWS